MIWNIVRPLGLGAMLLFVCVCLAGSCSTAPTALAGDFHHGHGFHRQHSYVQPVQQIFYFVGAPLRAEAIIEKQKQADPEWQEFLLFKRWKAEQAKAAQQPGPEPLPPQPLPAALAQAEPTSYIVQACARCHSGTAPKAGLLLDNAESITGIPAEARIAAMRRVMEGSMPPKSSLSPESRGDIIQEFLLTR